jgi:hypothetical protein
MIQATYATSNDAHDVRSRLIRVGISEDRIRVVDDAADSPDVKANLRPDDKGIWAQVREAVLPDDSNAATVSADKGHDAILELLPTQDEVEVAVQIIEDSSPTHFDGRLERWRNA